MTVPTKKPRQKSNMTLITTFYTNRGQKTLFKKPEWVPKSSSKRPVILRHSGVFCWLLYLWVFKKKKISPETVAKWNNYTCHPTCVHTHSQTRPWKHDWTHLISEPQRPRRGAIYLTSSPSSSIDRQMVHFSSVSSSAPSSSSSLPCSFLCLWETFRNVTFDMQHRSVKLPQQTHYIWLIILLIHSVKHIKLLN